MGQCLERVVASCHECCRSENAAINGRCRFREPRGPLTVRWSELDTIAAALDLVGPRLRRVREQRGITLTEVAERDRHLQEHPVAARERAAPAEPGAAAPAGPGLPGAAGRPRRGTRGGRPADPAQASARERPHGPAADPSPGRRPGLEDRHPAPARRHRNRAPTTATSGSTCSPAGCAWSSAPGTWSSGEGEAAEFDTQVPHWFGSTGDGPAEVLSIFGRPGEQMHVRATTRRDHGKE